MITSNLSVNRACPVYTLKTKKSNTQPSFKGNVVEKPAKKDKKEGMTTEQKTWLGVGLATIATVAIGLIAWACAKKTKPNEVSKVVETSKPNEVSKAVETSKQNEVSKVVEKVKLTPQQQQVEDLNMRLQKDFLLITVKKHNPRWEMVKVIPNVLAPFESKNEFQIYEMKVLVPQLLGRKAQLELYKDKKNVPQEKEIFIKYLKLRSEYYDKENEFDVIRSEVLKNPSEDVVDVETLRLHMLTNNTWQFLYSDDSVEEPHAMTYFVRQLLIANGTAKILEEFKPKKENLSENEKKYFEYMNKLGKFWHERLKKEASEKLPKFTKIITGEVEAPKCYTKGKEERHDKRRIFFPSSLLGFNLLYMLSPEAYAKWDDIMEKDETIIIRGRTATFNSLSSYIIKLEKSFMKLKHAVACNDDKARNLAEKEISELIPQVLV